MTCNFLEKINVKKAQLFKLQPLQFLINRHQSLAISFAALIVLSVRE